MPLSNQRFVTTWTSEDSIQWRMYIIPSSVDYITPAVSSNVTLPSEFLLRDMNLETELGSIPAGLVSQVLKINVNIAALQGTQALEDLRADLLRGTTTKRVPLLSDGSQLAFGLLTPEQREFDAFNTFVLQYNDGSGFKTAFIGCQKYSAENELEITALDNVITFSIEIFDIHRCIGEMITPEIWDLALMPTGESINYSPTISYSGTTEFSTIYVGKYTTNPISDTIATDIIPGNFRMYISTFNKLSSNISLLYSCYMRAITQNLSSSFVCHNIFSQTCSFYRQEDDTIIPPEYLCYVSRILNDKSEVVGGAHADPTMFAKFTNFHEVYKMLAENALETVRTTYTFTSGTPDVYTLTMVATNPYPSLASPSITFNEDNTYSSLKIKMLSEGLNQVNVEVSSIKGDKDTESYQYGKQGTSGDNSKDLNIMFHNTPLLTFRNAFSTLTTDDESYDVQTRNTINAGNILYFSNTEVIPEKYYQIKRPRGNMSITFGAESYSADYTPSTTNESLSLQIIKEQQLSTLPTTIAQAMVNFFGRPKQAEATLTTNFVNAKTNDVGKRCTIDLNDYNPLLDSIYGQETALAVITKHTHKIYEGMADVTLRIDAEAV